MADTSAGSPPSTTQTVATGGVFARKASGLVREFSQLDAWVYNVLALNVVVLISLAYVTTAATFPHASIWLAVVICGVLCTFEAVVYAFFLALMPRAGGEYVFQSRVLGGGIASVAVYTAIVLSQLVLVALTAYLGATLVFSPFFILLGAHYHWAWLVTAGTWIATKNGIFALSGAYIIWCASINIVGLRPYVLVQRYIFWVGIVTMVIVLVMLFTTSHQSFVSNFNSLMSKQFHVGNAYNTVIHRGGAGSTSFGLGPTLLAAVYFSLFLAFPHWGSFQGGEIKRANSFRKNLVAIGGAEVFSFIMIAIFAALLVSIVGSHFLFASGSLYISGAANNPLPVPPFFGFFVATAQGSAVFIWIAFIMFFCWWFMLAPNAPLGATRVMLAMSLDRALPDWFGRVNPRWHTPVNAIVVFTIGCLGFAALYAYATWFAPLTFAVAIPSLSAFGVTMVAAILLPKLRPSLFRGSEAAKYRIGPIPVMAVCAAVFLAFVVFIDVELFANSAYGVNGTKGLIFVAALYAAGLLTYIGMKLYRRRVQHVDISVAYKELPVE